MSRSPFISSAKTRVLRRLGTLMDFTRDLERNEDDTRFGANPDNTIHYILDNNIFGLFIQPRTLSHVMEVFHSREWTGMTTDYDAQINAQSGLIAAEYLLGGGLPGQVADRRLYMTEWHFRELFDGLDAVLRRVDADQARPSDDQAVVDRLLRRALNIGGKADSAKALVSLLNSPDLSAELKGDLRALREQGANDDVLLRVLIARLSAKFLTQDKVIEPLRQHGRLVSPEIAARLHPLHALVAPFDLDREAFNRDFERWLKLLKAERDLRWGQRRWRNEDLNAKARSDRSLRVDAKSLAYLLMIAQQPNRWPNQRFVLVTGDRLTFDVYRAWHADQAPDEPFLLRRTVQYAPILNFNDAPSDMQSVQALFESTRAAVETPLIVFKLAKDAGATEQPKHLAQGREHLALKFRALENPDEDVSLLLANSSMNLAWVKTWKEEFEVLKAKWQAMERAGIGANYELLRGRLLRHHSELGDRISQTGSSETGVVLAEYVRRLLDQIMEGSVSLFFSLAGDFISAGPMRSTFRNNRRPRAPIALRLRPPHPADAPPSADIASKDINTLLQMWSQDVPEVEQLLDFKTNSELAKRQDYVFAIAATLALRLGHWDDANRFAELALSAATRLPQGSETARLGERPSADELEIRYLWALAKRFRIGNRSPRGLRQADAIWRRLLDEAVKELTYCEQVHAARVETSPAQILMQVRAISERAAVKLFFASWTLIVNYTDLERMGATLADSSAQLTSALDDIRQCLALEDECHRAAETEGEFGQAFYKLVKDQYTTNFAAAYVFSSIGREVAANPDFPDLEPHEHALLSARLRVLRHDRKVFGALPNPWSIDILAYFAFAENDQKAADEIISRRRDDGGQNLILDQHVKDLIRKTASTKKK